MDCRNSCLSLVPTRVCGLSKNGDGVAKNKENIKWRQYTANDAAPDHVDHHAAVEHAAQLLILAVMAFHGLEKLLGVVADAVLEDRFDVLDVVDVA